MGEKDKLYYSYLQTSEISEDGAKAHKEIVAEYFWRIFNKNKCNSVLDVGCGLGHFLSKAPSGTEAVGLDANPEVVDHVLNMGIKAVLGNADRLPFDAGTMDGIMCAHLMEHVSDPEKVFSEFYRVLKNDGILVVRVPPFDSLFYDDWTHVRPFTGKALRRIAALCGFNEIEVFEYHYNIPFKYWKNPFFSLINVIRQLPGVRQGINLIIRRMFLLSPTELVLVAQKTP